MSSAKLILSCKESWLAIRLEINIVLLVPFEGTNDELYVMINDMLTNIKQIFFVSQSFLSLSYTSFKRNQISHKVTGLTITCQNMQCGQLLSRYFNSKI